ncbi:MAG: DUF4162 domain-containing protein, partial [Theionarchaea archaeon]|nr:DUF4162 domain-containing protein [Theionarchaea archaeon]
LKKGIPQDEVLEVRCLGHADFGGIGQKVYSHGDNGVTIYRIHAENVEEIMSEVIRAADSAKILSMNVSRPTLEDVFIHLTGTRLTGELHEE